MRKTALGFVAALVLASGLVGCRSANDVSDTAASRAYKGHENEADGNALISAYPNLAGTRVDDCQTCHRRGSVTVVSSSGEPRSEERNPCDYCHLIPFPEPQRVTAGAPGGYRDTLNPYGLAYLAAGRSREAIESIASQDSDEDGFDNRAELLDGRYPGDPASRLGQPFAPTRTLTRGELAAMPAHRQVMLLNASTQKVDDYVLLIGVRLVDLLAAAGVDLESPQVTGVTVFAPDGYQKSFPLAEVKRRYPPTVLRGGLDFVHYPELPDWLPAGVSDGADLPDEQWQLLAYERDGGPLETAHLDPSSGKIVGEGPFRHVVPQDWDGPAPLDPPRYPRRGPDRSVKGPALGDEWDYDSGKHHNAGDSTRAVVAIRVDPMPPGYEAFDPRNGGWALVAEGKLIVYGRGVQGAGTAD